MANEKRKTVLPFILNLSIALTAICIAAIGIIYFYSAAHVDEEIKTRARSYFNSIVITGKWNTNYGGVYAEKKPGVFSNPYIKSPDIKSTNGKTYTIKNTSVMTIEISGIAEKEGLFTYKLRSLRPLNPSSTSDLFETVSLAAFEHGQKENFDKIYEGGNIKYRYIAPLYITEECTKCHENQDYKIGDVGGGISITFDITDIEKNLAFTKYTILSLCILSLLLIAGVIGTSVKILKRKINDSSEKIERLAITDELTSLYNRKYFFRKLDEEFERSRRYGQTLALILTDIDSFREFNDRYGHQAGDAVLSSVAAIIKSSCRESDIPARYSGEEFTIILPATGRDGAAAMAEKLRKKISESMVNRYDFSVTVSLGISILTPEDAYSPTTLLYDADAALDRAKKDGRNRYIIA